jgi:hypothetical protein
MHIDGSRRDLAVVLPNHAHDLVSRHHAITMVHQVVQELHLFRGHVDRLAALARLRPIEIDIHIAKTKAPHRNARPFADAPKQRLHPRHQLRRVERFGEIVVGAELEPHHAIGHLGAR